ncbi:hypothetical protein FPRO03_11060 [Fusarium proliferatum]|uniref:Spindle pole body component n=1 Tax=Gibberella intermedia TaxID=948311 RepID=A0A365N5R9_GIBIN|nr:hypothetical protein FPRO03_11060 [Fusarium proliferatum]RBA16164.1 hypothetical protein FPRO05_12014 [Fusarium proliferatum]
MLHEILLSLSGHPSPLLRTDATQPHALSGVSPAERQLLASAAHLSDVHIKLISYTAQVANSHPSTICRAVATAIDSIHLAAFQRKVLDVEASILQDDPDLVGAYNIVPLTAVIGEFKDWTRRMEWLWEMVQFMLAKNKKGETCHGAQLMDRLRLELQSGYRDVQNTAMSLVTVAETAWLKQVSAWILYGRLPSFGGDDFFVQKVEESENGQHAEEDEQLELARDLLRLNLTKSKATPNFGSGSGLSRDAVSLLSESPFRNLLFSVPSLLSIQIPPPLDMVLSPSDIQIYSCINAYLLSMRRAHIRLTDLWKITSLRRQYPTAKGDREHIILLRKRWTSRSSSMRSSWTTASAAIFFLAETEAYLQTEIVAGLWEGFHEWLTANDPKHGQSRAPTPTKLRDELGGADEDEEEEDDLWLGNENEKPTGQDHTPKTRDSTPPQDPQTLSTAHRLYLRTLIHRLLLTQPTFTQPLYNLLIHIDHLVAHLHRLHAIYTSIDLETDAGVVDAFVDLESEERDVKRRLHDIESRVRSGIEDVVAALRALESDPIFTAEWEGDTAPATATEEDDDDQRDGRARDTDDAEERGGFTAARVGGINRLLMKLDFGTWFGRPDGHDDVEQL